MEPASDGQDRDGLRKKATEAQARAVEYLYGRQRGDGAWTDRLSSAAMATAIGVLALARAGRDTHHRQVETGLDWLRRNQRPDGGWSLADADPPSDGSVTAFALAALTVLDPEGSKRCIDAGAAFVESLGGESAILPNVRTWRELVSVIWAMEGLCGADEQPVQPLEVMLLPPRLRNRASIALPGVVGLGIWQSRVMTLSRRARLARRLAEPRGLAWLRQVQGPNGGMEECPLMAALVYLGLHLAGPDVGADIQRGCLDYLLATQRDDGSWAIDRDLEIAVTCYAVFALAECGDVAAEPRLRATRDWLLAARWSEPFEALTLPAGGWSWANPTGWPESEDTAVAMSTLMALGVPKDDPAIRGGLRWLLARQNRNGSWSEWVRDSSMVHDGPCAGVTSHVLMALRELGAGGGRPVARAFRYFEAEQHADGGIPSLWFRDRTHGTAKVLETYAEFGRADDPVARRARQWLLDTQRPDGSWPATVEYGPPDGGTVEETAWATYSLLLAGESPWAPPVARAVEYLVEHHDDAGTWRQSAVGMYYDQLNYSDDLIAHTYALRALARWLACVEAG
jgi:squalene-hopene/tetraprenyl-beta-curcumene cyclase